MKEGSHPVPKDKIGVVGQGGGFRFSYILGVLKALYEIDPKMIDCVSGTSAGSLGALAVALENYDKIEKMCKGLNPKHVIGEELAEENSDLLSKEGLEVLLKKFAKEGNLIDTKYLKTYIMENLGEEGIEKVLHPDSPNFCVTVTRQDTLKKEVIWKKDMTKDDVVDHILASCCFPIFKAVEIDGVKYRDGGFRSNNPINPLIEENYSKVLQVCLNGVGINERTLPLKNTTVIPIIPSNRERYKKKMEGIFDFGYVEGDFDMGYQDIMEQKDFLKAILHPQEEISPNIFGNKAWKDLNQLAATFGMRTCGIEETTQEKEIFLERIWRNYQNHANPKFYKEYEKFQKPNQLGSAKIERTGYAKEGYAMIQLETYRKERQKRREEKQTDALLKEGVEI